MLLIFVEALPDDFSEESNDERYCELKWGNYLGFSSVSFFESPKGNLVEALAFTGNASLKPMLP